MRLRHIMICISLCLGASVVSLADQVDVGDRSFARCKVVGFSEGRLEIRTSTGEAVRLALNEVTRVFVDTLGGMADFNAAEQFAAEGHPDEAVTRYERALRTTEGYWEELLRARLMLAADRGGRVDKAVVNFIRLVEGAWSGPRAAALLMPQRLPEELTREARFAIEQLDLAVNRNDAEDRRALIMLLRYDMLRRVTDPRAGVMATTVARMRLPEPIRNERTGSIQRAALESLLPVEAGAGWFAWMDQAIVDSVDAVAPDLLLLKGRALLESAKTREDVLRAGWAFMRVVIHFAGDVRAAEALLGAAEVHERIGRPDKAVRLLEECLALANADPETVEKARSSLERLGRRR